MNATEGDNRYFDPFPARLRDLLKEKHISQQTLADFVNVKRQTISAYANGDVEPTMSKLIGIAKFFDKSIDYLTGEHDCPTPDHQKIHERLGLSDKVIACLESENAPGQRTVHSPGFAGVINELVGSEAGQRILRVLSYYFFDDFKNGYRAGNTILDGDSVAQALLLNIPSDLKQVRDGIRARKRTKPDGAPADAGSESKEAPQ